MSDPSTVKEETAYMIRQAISRLQILMRNINDRNVDQNVVNRLVFVYAYDKSRELISLLQPIRIKLTNILEKTVSSERHRQSFSLLHFSLALILGIADDPTAQHYYQTAHLNDQANPQICLCFALFLLKRNDRSAMLYLDKLSIETALKQEHKQSVKQILVHKYSNQLRLNYYLNRNNSNSTEIFRNRFIQQSFSFAVEFWKAVIEKEEFHERNYCYLIAVLMCLNRREELLEYLQILREINPKQQKTVQCMARAFASLQMWKESISYDKKIVSLNPKNEEVYGFIIANSIELKQFQQAEQYTWKLLQIRNRNHEAYYYIGRILSQQGRDAQAIEWSKASLRLHCALSNMRHSTDRLNTQHQIAYNYGNSRYSFAYSSLGYSLMKLGRFTEAARSYSHAARLLPISDSFNQLSFCFSKLGQKLNAIECSKQAITLDYAQLISYIVLSDFAQKSASFRHSINAFMDRLKQTHAQSLHVEFNVALFYYLSKQSHRRFHELIQKYLKGDEDQSNQRQWSDVIAQTLKKYQTFTLSFLNKNPIFSMIIGILSRAKGSTEQSHECFTNVFNLFKAKKKQSASEVMSRIYQKLLCQTREPSLFLEWIANQTLQQSPKEALRCHSKALCYCKGDYDDFEVQFQRKMEENIQLIDEIEQIVISTTIQQHKRIDERGLIDLEEFNRKMQRMRSVIANLRAKEKDSPKMAANFPLFLTQESLLKETIIGISWTNNNKFNDCFSQVRKLIDQSEETIIMQIKKYAKIYKYQSDKTCFTKGITPLLQSYFEEQFAVNQTIKILFNSFVPFVPLIAQSYNQFAAILVMFKQDPHYGFQGLKRDLKELFQYRPQQSSAVEEQGEPSSETTVESDLREGFAEGRVYVREETQSQADPSNYQSQFFTPKGGQKARKLSDSAAGKLTPEEYDKFIESITAKRQDSLFKAILVPFQGAEQNPSIRQDTEQNSSIGSNSSEEGEFQQEEPSLFGGLQQERRTLWSSISSSHYSLGQNPYKMDFIQYGAIPQAGVHLNPHYIKFQGSRLYANFNKALFQNTFFLIRYVSANNGKNHIAKHAINGAFTTRTQSFEVEVERGDEVRYPFITETDQERTLKWLWLMGERCVLQWIGDTAEGVAELEEMGVYHADLAIRNTVRVSRRGRRSAFKIIDFDKAFKVVPTEEKDKAFESTKSLLDFWLRFRFDLDKPQAPFDQISHFESSSRSSSEIRSATEYNQKDIIKYIFRDADEALIDELLHIKNDAMFSPLRLQKCVQKLKDYMNVSHRMQYRMLVRKLLLDGFIEERNSAKYLKGDAILYILSEVEALSGGKVDFREFAANMQKLRVEAQAINSS